MYYYILKNPFKTASIESVLSMMGTIPYFYDQSTLLGGYTQYLTPLRTHQEVEDKRERRFQGWVYAAEPGDELFDLDPPVDAMQSPRGWLVGRADMVGCCGFGPGCEAFPEESADEGEAAAAAWKRNLQQTIDHLAKHLDDEYHSLTFPEHPTGDFYIVDSVPNPTTGGGDGGKMRRELDRTLEEVRAAVSPGPPAVDHPQYARHTTYIPQPAHYSVSDLLFDLWHLRKEHYGEDADKHEVSVITRDNDEFVLTHDITPSYWKFSPGPECISAPNGWIVIEGTPEANRAFIEKIYPYLIEDERYSPPDVTPVAFAPHVKNTAYSSRIAYYPVDPNFYHEPV